MKAIYFSHDTNSFYDPKIRHIVGEHGVWAYGIFWIIIEMLATQRDFRIKKEGFLNGLLPIIQGRLSICLADLQNLFNDFFLVELLIEKDGFFYSESLLERMKIRQEISLKRMESGRLGGISKGKQMLSKQDSNCLAVKESKVKESKVLKAYSATPTFIKPSIDDVKNFCSENNLPVLPEKFFDYYQSNGWKIGGRGSMKDWKAALRNWARNDFGNTGKDPDADVPLEFRTKSPVMARR